MPRVIGPMIRSRVQIAATPMVPAPMKRTFSRKVVPTSVSMSVAEPSPAQAGLPGHQHEPADDQADQHGDADGHADQVADADQRHRQAGRDGRRAAGEAEGARRFGRDELGLGEDRVGGRDDRAPDDHLAGRGGSPRPRRRRRRPSALRPPRRLPDRAGRSRSRARAAAAPNRSRRGCRRWRSPRPTARRGSRSTSRP